jgi:hypothetical protein
MSIKGKACIAGIYEHPMRHAPDKSVAELHAEVAAGALASKPTWTAISAPASEGSSG